MWRNIDRYRYIDPFTDSRVLFAKLGWDDPPHPLKIYQNPPSRPPPSLINFREI